MTLSILKVVSGFKSAQEYNKSITVKLLWAASEESECREFAANRFTALRQRTSRPFHPHVMPVALGADTSSQMGVSRAVLYLSTFIVTKFFCIRPFRFEF